MHTRGQDKDRAGCFAYELWASATMVERVGGFATHTEADAAASLAERRLLGVGFDVAAYRRLYIEPAPAFTGSLADLLAELQD